MGFKIAAFGMALIIVIVGGALAYGALRWRNLTRSLVTQLDAASVPPQALTYSESELEGLPDPVQRYFRAVLREGQPIVTRARLTWEGEFLMRETEDGWRPFTATQHYVTRRPGFLWDARIQMAPGLAVHVYDAYIAGAGMLHGEVLGLVQVVHLGGTSEMAEGELLRYLAEAVWYPTALLPGQGVQWTPMDGSRARATLTDGETTVSLVFHFNAAGEITSSYATSRPREVKGEMRPTPWAGSYADYAERDGMRIPTRGEVAWHLEDRRLPYWRGRVLEVAYEYAQPANNQ
jgi:hypothetical protein